MKKTGKKQWTWAILGLLALGLILGLFFVLTKQVGKEEEFIVGFDAEFPPYGYRDDNGEYVGFDLDLAAEVCKRNGWKLVKRPIAWDSKDSELASALFPVFGMVLR